jgi:hypothetical protein
MDCLAETCSDFFYKQLLIISNSPSFFYGCLWNNWVTTKQRVCRLQRSQIVKFRPLTLLQTNGQTHRHIPLSLSRTCSCSLHVPVITWNYTFVTCSRRLSLSFPGFCTVVFKHVDESIRGILFKAKNACDVADVYIGKPCTTLDIQCVRKVAVHLGYGT